MSGTSWLVSGMMAKFVILAVVVAFTIFAVPRHEWIGLALVIAAAALFVSVSASSAVPLEYLFPGTVLLLVFRLHPVISTVISAFTDYGEVHRQRRCVSALSCGDGGRARRLRTSGDSPCA